MATSLVKRSSNLSCNDNVQAVREAGRPEGETTVKSFLGMIWYLSKFIPNYTIMTAPLRALRKKDVDCKWVSYEQRTFEKHHTHLL